MSDTALISATRTASTMSTYQRCCRRDRVVDKKAPFSCVRPSDAARCCACPEDTRQFHSGTEDSARSVPEQTHLEMLACRALGRPDCSIGAAEHATPSQNRPPAAVLPDSSSWTPACSGRDVKRPRRCWGEQGRGRLLLERFWGLLEQRHLESLGGGGTRPGTCHGTRRPGTSNGVRSGVAVTSRGVSQIPAAPVASAAGRLTVLGKLQRDAPAGQNHHARPVRPTTYRCPAARGPAPGPLPRAAPLDVRPDLAVLPYGDRSSQPLTPHAATGLGSDPTRTGRPSPDSHPVVHRHVVPVQVGERERPPERPVDRARDDAVPVGQ